MYKNNSRNSNKYENCRPQKTCSFSGPCGQPRLLSLRQGEFTLPQKEADHAMLCRLITILAKCNKFKIVNKTPNIPKKFPKLNIISPCNYSFVIIFLNLTFYRCANNLHLQILGAIKKKKYALEF